MEEKKKLPRGEGNKVEQSHFVGEAQMEKCKDEERAEKEEGLKEQRRLEELFACMSLSSNVYNWIHEFLNNILVFENAY